jgi:hypothetical protein
VRGTVGVHRRMTQQRSRPLLEQSDREEFAVDGPIALKCRLVKVSGGVREIMRDAQVCGQRGDGGELIQDPVQTEAGEVIAVQQGGQVALDERGRRRARSQRFAQYAERAAGAMRLGRRGPPLRVPNSAA